MSLRKEIDGSKFDIRVICTGPGESEDAGYVEGVPIDPPDKSSGWMLVDLWVEHDTQQEQIKGEDKGEKAKIVTKLVNPAFYQIWARKKVVKPKRRSRKPKTTVAAEVAAEVKPVTPTPRVRKKKTDKTKTKVATPPESEKTAVAEVSELS